MKYVIGIDEVGRGPIAGPLVVCACAVRDDVEILTLFPKGVLKDSKKLSEKNRIAIRTALEPHMESRGLIYGLGEVSAEEIDTYGLSKAIKEGVRRALDRCHAQGVPKEIMIYLDGSLHADDSYLTQKTVIRGDETIGEIALASIIAKVYRDTLMKEIASSVPEYGFERHVGYGTKYHYDAIKKNGLTKYHRRSFLKNKGNEIV